MTPCIREYHGGRSNGLEEALLEVTGARKRYGSLFALDGCTFVAAPGRMLGFLGPNGSGKTTAMRSIFGLVRLDEGRIAWQGREVGPEQRARFGYMPEERGLYPRMRVGDQLRYFARLHGVNSAEARRAAARWLEAFGLSARVASRVEDLSHGNAQRVQLAVALVHEPDLLVLDEPFQGLDPLGVAALGEIVRSEAARGAAVFFSSHQLDLVQDLCDDVAIIDHGRIVLAGSVAEVRSASRFRYAQLAFDGEPAPAASGAPWLPGAEVLWERGHELRLRVATDIDPAVVLAAAQSRGRVTAFHFEPPSLSDLFMEAVQP